MIKLIILDVDGVMTSGKKLYDLKGDCIAKEYCDRDFTAIKQMKSLGLNVCLLSSDENVNKAMAKKRNIDFFYSRGSSGSINKVSFLPELQKKYDCTSDEIVYIGDDLFDLDIIQAVKYSYCPDGSEKSVRESVTKILPCKSGDHVVQCLYEELLDEGFIKQASVEDVKRLDSKEAL